MASRGTATIQKLLGAAAFLALLPATACSSAPDFGLDGDDADVDDVTRGEAVATTTNAVGQNCYCSGAYACGHSKSPSYMHTKARAALGAAGVPESALTQTYGDAAASVGTHCPEPNAKFSAATDMQQSGDPCGRTRKLRLQGFAAWYRTAPEFPGNNHIHAVYAGAPGIKASLQRQVASFLQGRNGLAGNGVDNHCPITDAEKEAVRLAQSGGPPTTLPPAPPAPNDPAPNDPAPNDPAPVCVVGGKYCGGDKLVGDPSTLYVCNADGSGTVLEQCANGCSVNPGVNDTCN
jgi:hypothetical protein